MNLNWDPESPAEAPEAGTHDFYVRKAFSEICARLMNGVGRVNQLAQRPLVCEPTRTSLRVHWEGKSWHVLRLNLVPRTNERNSHIELEARQMGRPEMLKGVLSPSDEFNFHLRAGDTEKTIPYILTYDLLLRPALHDID